jgi:hypothetical protein
MQSTKYLLLLLAALAFAVTNAADPDPVDEANGRRCRHLDGTSSRKCDACCALLSLENNKERQYKYSELVWRYQSKRCVCMRTVEDLDLGPAKIKEYTDLLGDQAPSATAKTA